MQAAVKRDLVAVEDYLAGEEASPVKHDYIGGSVYAMAGATTEHNQIALNLAVALRAYLKGKPCRVFMSDVKVRMEISDQDIFYYPDVMVGCDPRDTQRQYLRHPGILVEVLFDSTERLDRGEKRFAYQTIETLEEYVLVAQDRTEVTLYRRANRWHPEVLGRLDQAVALESIGLRLPLSTVYDGVISS